METTNVNPSATKNTKILNKFGTIAFGLIVIGSFLPVLNTSFWGSSASITGADAYGFFVVFLMFTGAASSAMGLPKILAKGIAGFSLAYLYYYLFGAISDLIDMASMFGGRRSSGVGSLIEIVVNVFGIGAFVLLAGFVLLNLFMFKSYRLHPRFEALETLLEHYTSQVAEKTATKSAEIKKAAEEKAAQVKKEAADAKTEVSSKEQ
ncbi:hypothetical protein L1D16_14945 [Vibrio sp. Isolate31]|uniref:hypothetical protein n=1 Tax=unclassified Vibrio TaxID=2614977 RepID=UPI001EFEE393|nr:MULTISPECIES: hypothetical protein [unclassified Vibrio]MCG9554568.1 hypothetical protein [Vibrio sp. Isolate32]MCG9602124.1 hypothetical protein [Vibrio sp. Isolate31]